MSLFRASPLCSLYALLALAPLVGCGSNGSTPSYPAPVLSSLSPSAVMVGSPALTLTVTGSNFLPASTVNWNGTPIPTQYLSAGSLQASVTAAQLTTANVVAVTVTNAAADGGAGSNRAIVTISSSPNSNPVPALTSLSVVSADEGSPVLGMWVTGTGFVSTSTVDWNGAPLPTSYTSSTSLLATIPASDLVSPGNYAVTVVNPAPDGGTSGSLNFTVIALGSGTQVSVFQPAQNLVWDPINSVIYLAQSTAAGNTANAIETLNPQTGALGASVSLASQPDLMAVSSSSKYLYVSLPGTSTVQRLTLPNFGTDIAILFGSDSTYGPSFPFFALDLQASPTADGTVAVVRGVSNLSTPGVGGVLIYDDGVARSSQLCDSPSCQSIFGSIQWNHTATQMYAADNESSAAEFYSVPVTSTGFGTVTTYPALLAGFNELIHYDAITGYVYVDSGQVIDPSNGTIVGNFAASGMMVPDGANGRAYFLMPTISSDGTSTYAVHTFDIHTFNPISTVSITHMLGVPTHFIRWGNGGVAFTTAETTLTGVKTGAVFTISGTLLSGSAQSSSANHDATLGNP